MGTATPPGVRWSAEAMPRLPQRSERAFADPHEMLCELEVRKHEHELQQRQLRDTESALEVAREHYRELLEFVPLGCLLVGMDGIVEANRRAGEILGVPASQLEGMQLADFVAPADRGAFQEHLRRASISARSAVEVTLLRGSGQKVEVRLESIRTRSALADWRVAITDLTEEKRLARQVLEFRGAEAVGPVTRELAHDLGHVLMEIVGEVDGLLQRLDPHVDFEPRLRAIRELALFAGAMSHRVLDRARSQSLVNGKCVLDDGVRGASSLLKQVAGDRIAVSLALGLPEVEVPLTAMDLEQILLNLATNARDAMPEGGKLLVATYCARSEFDGPELPPHLDPRQTVVLEMGDSGPGFSEEALSNLFEPHFTSKGEAGTGLGLSTIHAMVRRVGGHVSVRSVPGAGASIFVALPRLAQQACNVALPPFSVLVVDDEVLVRVSARRALEHAGYRVFEAGSAEAALELLHGEAGEVGLILSDVGLPGASGPELVERARSIVPDLQAIFMSGDSYSSLRSDERIDSKAELLQKPFGQKELLDAISRSKRCGDARREG